MGLFEKVFGTHSERELKHIEPIARSVFALEESCRQMSEEQLRGTTDRLKARLAEGVKLDDLLPEAYAVCREASDRVLGMRHFPVQVIGGIVLHQGRIAEMKTGEGKTLVATLPAYLNALAGKGVHIVTVNDYLAKFQSEWMGRLYEYLGLTTGLIVHGKTTAERKASYACDITYGTNNEFGFDYLRDNMVTRREDMVQRGHHFVIVDEVDSILIDEARTPLIISGSAGKPDELYEQADAFAKQLHFVKFVEMDDKEDVDTTEAFAEADYIVDEKRRTATLTARGIEKAEQAFHVENLSDPENSQLAHHINQAIKAQSVMRRDIDYVVKDNQVIIVDEFTGRLMFGRRYNEGLHQAIEAKEHVKVERESKTLATITFQNFFRLYHKLSGMTGTAMTEEEEFRNIYNLDVVEIPTNRPMIRTDHNDSIYKNTAGKYNAIIEQVIACHEKGQPVLVGTVSIEKSEILSGMLKRRGIRHEVLNAKHHEREAAIVAQAGQYGAVTIATNMAGRGTDIILGGNAEFMARSDLARDGYDDEMIANAVSHAPTQDEAVLEARARFAEALQKHQAEIADSAEKVRAAGGLFIIGTERHESRRIDNQLRGRSGRQGDPGESRFFLSMEDDLMRLFGGERVGSLMATLNVPDDQPIEYGMLSKTIEGCQRRVEENNFGIRKNVLQFDDVNNQQREVIYGQRRQVLDGQDLSGTIRKMVSETIRSTVQTFVADSEPSEEWNINGLRDHFLGWLTTQEDFRELTGDQLDEMGAEGFVELLQQRADEAYARQEETFGDMMREVERAVLLRNVDLQWMDHIDALDDLKAGIYLRGYGQKDPFVEYSRESSEMFDAMTTAIRENTARDILSVRKREERPIERTSVVQPTGEHHTMNYDKGQTQQQAPVKKTQKVGRNDPCPCGSGKKYKKCCGANLDD